MPTFQQLHGGENAASLPGKKCNPSTEVKANLPNWIYNIDNDDDNSYMCPTLVSNGLEKVRSGWFVH